MVQLIKKRIYKPDKSYTYNFYKIVGNKKKKISSKRYHEYMNKIQQKRKNNIQLILISGGSSSIQYGGLAETADNAARDFEDLTDRVRKHKNNSDVNLAKSYVIKHGISTKDDGSITIDIETENKIKDLLEFSDFDFNTKFMYMNGPDGKAKKYMVIIPKDKDAKKVGRYIEDKFDTKDFNKFSLKDNLQVITPQQLEEYFEVVDREARTRINLKKEVDGQINKYRVLTSSLAHYLDFLHDINARLGLKLNKIRDSNKIFFDKNVSALDTQVIFALITNEFAKWGQRGFHRTPNPVKYNVANFKRNFKTYKDVMANHTYKEFARFCRTTLDSLMQLNSYHYDPIAMKILEEVDEYNWKDYISKFDIYRDYLRKSFVPGVAKVQCGALKVIDGYFSLVNERVTTINKRFMGRDGDFTLTTSKLCDLVQGGGAAPVYTPDTLSPMAAPAVDPKVQQQVDLMMPGSSLIEAAEAEAKEFKEKLKEKAEEKRLLSEKEKRELEQQPNENIYYDIFKGFRPDDSFNPGKFVEFTEQILQYEISKTEILKLIEINTSFKAKIKQLIKLQKSSHSRAEMKIETYLIECEKYSQMLFDTDIPILQRLDKLKEYKSYVEETMAENNKYLDALAISYASFNFDITSLMKRNLNAEIDAIDRNDNEMMSVGLIDLRKTYKSKVVKKLNDGEKEIKPFRFLEFYAEIFKKLIVKKKENETCGLVSPFNFEKIAACIENYPKKFYKNHDYAKLILMGQDLKTKQATIASDLTNSPLEFGYMHMDEMYDTYNELHPFFYDEIAASINEWDEKQSKKSQKVMEKQGTYLAELEQRKSGFQEQLKQFKLQIVAEQESAKRGAELEKVQVMAMRLSAEQAKQAEEKKMAEEAKEFDVKAYESQTNNRINMQVSKLERQLKDIDEKILDFKKSQAMGETKQAMDLAVQAGGDLAENVEYAKQKVTDAATVIGAIPGKMVDGTNYVIDEYGDGMKAVATTGAEYLGKAVAYPTAAVLGTTGAVTTAAALGTGALGAAALGTVGALGTAVSRIPGVKEGVSGMGNLAVEGVKGVSGLGNLAVEGVRGLGSGLGNLAVDAASVASSGVSNTYKSLFDKKINPYKKVAPFDEYVNYIKDMDGDLRVMKKKPGLDAKTISLKRNQRVWLEHAKYGDLKHIYLLNAGCRDFNPHSYIWGQSGKDVDIRLELHQANDSSVSKPQKELLTTSLGKKFESNGDIEKGLESCSEYRLRSIKRKDEGDFEKHEKYKVQSRIKKTVMGVIPGFKDLLRNYDMWTIQKNISRQVLANNTDLEELEWIDLAEIKLKFPKKLSTLDDMLLSNNEFRRKRALERLIRYVSYPTSPEDDKELKKSQKSPDNLVDWSAIDRDTKINDGNRRWQETKSDDPPRPDKSDESDEN